MKHTVTITTTHHNINLLVENGEFIGVDFTPIRKGEDIMVNPDLGNTQEFEFPDHVVTVNIVDEV